MLNMQKEKEAEEKRVKVRKGRNEKGQERK